MKNWPILFSAIYVVVTGLLIWFALEIVEKPNERKIDDVFLAFGIPGVFIGVFAQFLLIQIKVDVTEKRLVPQRNVHAVLIITGFFMAAMVTAGIMTISAVAARKDHLIFEGITPVLLPLIFFGTWVFWAVVFSRTYYNEGGESFINKIVARMMAGSVLELMIALPSHVFLRKRHDCCAPIFSSVGIISGICVMLLAFGPAVIFLYLKRIRDKKPKSQR